MHVIVVDWNYKFMEDFEATYINGVLSHKRGERRFGWGVLSFKTGGVIEDMEFDYHKTIDSGKERLAIYQWDGKNLHQLTFFDVPESSTLIDFKREWEIAKMAEETAIKPPEDKFMKFAMGIWAIVVIISSIALVYATTHVSTVYSNLAHETPVYNISSQNAEALKYFIKSTNQTQLEVSSMVSYLGNLTRYLNAKIP